MTTLPKPPIWFKGLTYKGRGREGRRKNVGEEEIKGR